MLSGITPPRAPIASSSSWESHRMRESISMPVILFRICQRQSFQSVAVASGKNCFRKAWDRGLGLQEVAPREGMMKTRLVIAFVTGVTGEAGAGC